MPNSKATPVDATVSLPVDHIELAETGDWHCPSCQHDLDLSQPSAQNPDMLLGTCPRCDAWFLFYQSATSPHCLVLRLPTATEVESAAAAAPASAPARGKRSATSPQRSHRRG